MHLDSTLRKIQAVLAGAVAANQCPIVVGWTDTTTTTMVGGGTPINTNSTTAVDCVPAPAASTARKVNNLTIYNADTAAITVTFRYNDNGTNYTIEAFTLLPGETLQYTDRGGWAIVAAPAPGRLIRVVTVTSASANHTTSANCRTIFIRGIAGGGAGGGGSTTAAQSAVGGGGSSGGYLEKTFAVSPSTAYAYTCGAGGTAGTAGNNPGNDGANSTFVVGGVTVTCFGGKGGAGMATGTTILSAAGGASPAVSTNGDMNSGGMPGEYSRRGAATLGCSGAGGSSYMGPGGNALNAQGTGNTASVGFGGGGGGGACINGGGNVAGGAGAPGAWVIEEYT